MHTHAHIEKEQVSISILCLALRCFGKRVPLSRWLAASRVNRARVLSKKRKILFLVHIAKSSEATW